MIEQLVCEREWGQNWNPGIVEFDEVGNDQGDFGTRVTRDAEEVAELTGRFAGLGLADAGDFGDGF